MKKKNLRSADGCFFALLIIYFQETLFGVDSEEADAQPPWLVYWKDSTLKRRIKYEFEDPAGLAHQARSRTPTRAQKKIKTKIKIPPTKNEIMNSTLAESLQIEGPPSQKKTLGKKKQTEEEKSSSESEPESESESESETASDLDSEKTISEAENVRNVKRTKKRHEAINAEPLQPTQHAEADDNPAAAIGENVGIIEKRTKKRHEAINAAPLQPPQQGEADANPDVAIDTLADPSSQVNVNLSSDVEIENITPLGDTETQEDPTKDVDFAAAMAVEEEDIQHDAVIVDATIATTPPKYTVPTAATGVESAEEENTHHNAMLVDATIETAPPNHIVPAAAMGVESAEEEDTAIVDASIAEPSRVIEEAALTDLYERITTHQHVAPEKNLEESVTRPEEEASEQELTLRDLPEIQKA
ncbi:hypothetical protein PIB30_068631 [Stylosanthes scabra]|uniref:Uncharacterized protein n=1 Tax=Stylosanthes scabra TaxID=79078 RepID=A0ABU6TMP2_9FABA|nr:hypothetical protein [Stylosanthes scabra]